MHSVSFSRWMSHRMMECFSFNKPKWKRKRKRYDIHKNFCKHNFGGSKGWRLNATEFEYCKTIIIIIIISMVLSFSIIKMTIKKRVIFLLILAGFWISINWSPQRVQGEAIILRERVPCTHVLVVFKYIFFRCSLFEIISFHNTSLRLVGERRRRRRRRRAITLYWRWHIVKCCIDLVKR